MNTPSDGSNTPRTQNGDASTQRESHLRSLLKALSWRVLATTTTGLIVYCLLRFGTSEDSARAAKTALSIAAVEFVLKFAIYYLHERAWQLVPRGAIRQIYSRSS